MPEIVCYESVGREFTVGVSGRDSTREWFVRGAANEEQAEAAVLAASPAYLGTPGAPNFLVRKTVKGREVGAAAMHFVTVEYGQGERSDAVGEAGQGPVETATNEPLGPEWTIETSAQTAHITQAEETIYRRVARDQIATVNGQVAGPDFIGNGPDEYLAIGLSKDRVEGCDIFAPSLVMSRAITYDRLTMDFVNQALYGLVGRTNAEPFFNFDAGEVLYLGATGGQTEGTKWRLTHKFAMSPNEGKKYYGGVAGLSEAIEVPKKGGWEYLWVSYRWKEVSFPAQQLVAGAAATTETILVQVPHCVYVQRVYKSGNFNLLGVGGARTPEGKAVEKAARAGKFVANLGGLGGGGIVINPGVPGDDFGGGGEF